MSHVCIIPSYPLALLFCSVALFLSSVAFVVVLGIFMCLHLNIEELGAFPDVFEAVVVICRIGSLFVHSNL